MLLLSVNDFVTCTQNNEIVNIIQANNFFVFSFFKKYDLNGKTIIPFTTHEGSGLGSVVEDLKGQYPKATVTNGFSISGHNVRGGMDKVDKWLKELGY